MKRDGPNAITPPTKAPAIFKFFKHMLGGFSILLWSGSLLCFIAFGIQESKQPGKFRDNVSRLERL